MDGCSHTLERMQEWSAQGACPICLTAALGMANKEIERLKAGDFTDEEFQNLCHRESPLDACAFANGCHEYQRKLFGKSERDAMQAEIGRLKAGK